MSRFDQCTETCTADCGHCKGRPVAELRAANANLIRNAEILADELIHASADRDRLAKSLAERHPESYCHRCGGPNVYWWSAPSPLWNQVMRGGSINGRELFQGIVCPVCFAALAEEQGVTGRSNGWRFAATDVLVELETVTPSGRVWDEAEQLWMQPERTTP